MARLLRVLQLVSCPAIGGTETFVLGLTAELRRINLDVRIANLATGALMAERANQAQLPYVELGAGVTPLSVAKLFNHLRRNHFDVVCAYGLRASLAMRVAGSAACGPVLVTGLRGLDSWRRWYHVYLDRMTEATVTCFVCNSDEVARVRNTREKTPHDKLVTIPNGIDTNRFDRTAELWPTREAVDLPARAFLCATVANMRAPKGHSFLLDVIAATPELPKDVFFLWIGDQREWPELCAKALRLNVLQRIIPYGPVTDVRPLLANSDLFVLPSREEGMPRALMEAMSMGLPSLATRVGGTPEVVRDGTDGILVPFGDVRATSAQLSALLHDSAKRSALGSQAAERIRSQFSFSTVAKRYADLFARLAHSRTLRP